MKIRIWAIAIMLSLSIVLSGCGLITRFLPEDLEEFLEDFFSGIDDFDLNGNDETYVNDETTGQGDRAPTSDSEGKDIDNVPRYPGSVRTQYSELFNVISVSYVAQGAALDDVREFFAEELEKNGWNITLNYIQAGEAVTMQASSEEGQLVLAATPSNKYEDSLEIEIVLYTDE